MDKSFVMLVGLPGAGKSTLVAERFENQENTVIISSDAFIAAAAEKNGISYMDAYTKSIDEANSRCFAEARQAFAAGKNVVWDQTNISMEDRARKLQAVPDEYFKVAITFELAKSELIDRAVARYRENGKIVAPDLMDALSEDYERPGRFEGFDYIEIITE